MTEHTQTPAAIAFSGMDKIASGTILEVALASKTLLDRDANTPLLVLDYLNSHVIELDLRGSAAKITERLGASEASNKHEEPAIAPLEVPQSLESRGRGRPKLGVMAREVTLLPRHWHWLGEQPGGASVTLRKLVEQARHASANKDLLRAAQESAYRFMSALAGDLPGFEEAIRALFAPDSTRFTQLASQWPSDVGAHALLLARRAFDAAPPPHKN